RRALAGGRDRHHLHDRTVRGAVDAGAAVHEVRVVGGRRDAIDLAVLVRAPRGQRDMTRCEPAAALRRADAGAVLDAPRLRVQPAVTIAGLDDADPAGLVDRDPVRHLRTPRAG